MSDAERPPDEVRSEVSVHKGQAPEREGVTRASQSKEPAAGLGAGPVHSRRCAQWRDAFQRRLPPWWSRAACARC